MLGHTKKLPLSGWKCKFCRFMSQERTPPSSLLQRQAKRRGIQPTVAPSQLIVTSLKDIFSSFNPAGYAPEDEELEINQQREDTMRKIEHGDLRNLLLRKLAFGPTCYSVTGISSFDLRPEDSPCQHCAGFSKYVRARARSDKGCVKCRAANC